MTRFDNNAEGGTNGSPVSTADVSSGTPWTNVLLSGGSPTWTNAAIDGLLSILFSGTAAQRFVGWDDTTSAQAAVTLKLTVPGAATATARIIDVRSSSGSLGNLIMANGTTTLTANAGTGATTAASISLTAGTIYWVTLVWTGIGTAAGAVTMKIYDASGTLLDTKSASGGTTALPILRIRYGAPTATELGMPTGMVIDRVSQDIGSSTEIVPPAVRAVSVVSTLGGSGVSTVQHVLVASAGAAVGGAGLVTARKVSTPTGRSAIGAAAAGGGRKTATTAARAALGGSATGAGRKVSAVAARAAAGMAATGSLAAVVARAVTGWAGIGMAAVGAGRKTLPVATRAAAGASATGTGRKVSPTVATAAAGSVARVTARKTGVVTGLAAVGAVSRGVSLKTAAVAARGVLGAAARSAPGKRVAVVGRSVLGVLGYRSPAAPTVLPPGRLSPGTRRGPLATSGGRRGATGSPGTRKGPTGTPGA